MELLQALKEVKAKVKRGDIIKWAGLCYNLECVGFSDTKGEKLQSLFRSWPLFSGNIEYPVHRGIKSMSKHAYTTATTDNMWNPKTVYGHNRLDLLNWCIEQLEAKEKPVEYKAGQRLNIAAIDGKSYTVILANVAQWKYALINLESGNRIKDAIELFPKQAITEEHMKQMLGPFKIVS
jgi:hypothetical protein